MIQSSSPDWIMRNCPLCPQCLRGENHFLTLFNLDFPFWHENEWAQLEINDLTGEVISAAIEVHKNLGPGLLESVYEECLCRELDIRNVPYERQKELPIEYKGVKLNFSYRLDMVVEGRLILELKSCENLQPIHEAQLLTYLKLTGIKVGLLINFNVPVLKEGIKRIAN